MERLISLIGIVVFFGLGYLLSVDRKAIPWRTVAWGFAIQFLFAVFVIRIPFGFSLFNYLGNLVTTFLNFSDVGAKFVFGDNYQEHFFAFKVMPSIIFFSAFTSVLYHYGILQRVVGAIAFLMQRSMKTSGPETTSCAANIFIGQTEAPLLIKPFVDKSTLSEIHAIMTGGFATIAGGVMAAYISFGISAQQLIAASVMNAPGALAMSKLMFPEIGKFSTNLQLQEEWEKSKAENQITSEVAIPEIEERSDNVISAIASGAIDGIKLVLNIIAILIAFVALMAFINAVLAWIGGLVGFPKLSLEWILSFVLAPLAFLMGVPWQDCGQVGILLGKKTIINEFVAYVDLKDMIGANSISARAISIATFALCGFANIASIGVQIGGIGGIAPRRLQDVSNLGVRAMIAGTLTNFVTAAIAGLLI